MQRRPAIDVPATEPTSAASAKVGRPARPTRRPRAGRGPCLVL